ncbi:coenzyme F420-0:L-glutamate ligase [Aneurinibacillus tyrosinisolvens]|uniref:coenzyme F420-0:L-glutamate ligase n=1 Tax=Aneurinibacillus tyrosinisolvens TaxID=1443435 RepID=UPI00063F58A5|nr:coenzyme F420-0:L-glutamate ligase [Aneurinibacillus tyrosinisolvens]
MSSFTVMGIEGIPEVSAGDDLALLIIEALDKQGIRLEDEDIVIVTSKIVSKAEGRIIARNDVQPSSFAIQLAQLTKKDPFEVEIILRESLRPIKVSDHVLIMETKQGFICANAGIDQSNVGDDDVFLLLPLDADASAMKIRTSLENHYGINLAVIISDTFGRPWRMGQTNVAIGISGMSAISDYKGKYDYYGRELKSTEIAITDQIAASAEMVMGKADGIPVAVIRGYSYPKGDGKAKHLIRPKQMDLFR